MFRLPMRTQLVTCNISSLHAQYTAAEKDKFLLYLLPHYRHALRHHQLDDFFASVHTLLLDRFLPPGLDPNSEEHQTVVLADTDAFDLALMLSCIHPDYRDVAMRMDDWRPLLTLKEDHKRRREEWEARGGGEPNDHQYIVAYEVEETTYSYLRSFISCFIG
ncbi:hypothetical protein EYR38_009866 [Pleurotus pulmonarius]|nr:hypothetical protein EYR38_009866 [Pleurotus pulmonarius]